MATHTAFFYGTLMAPAVLSRVTHGPAHSTNPIHTASKPFTTRPAMLSGYRRHRVRGADYPAILPVVASDKGTKGSIGEVAEVRGTWVSGLTEADLWRLDIFEGDEYSRQRVKVRLLDGEGVEAGKGEMVEAETYVWIAGERRLEAEEWDFDEFVREKMRFWVGSEGEGEYAGRSAIIAVDDAVAAHQASVSDGTGGRGFNGHIAQALELEQKKDLLRSAV